MCQKEQHHGRLRGEIAEVDATNSVLRQSNSRKEAEKRFQIIRMRKERDATLDLIGRAQQELRALRASRRSLVNELEAIGQRADKARVASTLMQKGADKLVESSEVVDDSLAVEAMVHSLKQLNRHLELAQRHNEVLEAHTFVDLPVVPPSEDHSRLDHLRRKLKAVKKTVRRLRARIADFRPEPVATPPAAVLPSLPVNVAVPSLSMARLENIESRFRTLESSVLKRRGVIQHKRSRLSRVNDFYLNPPPVCENLHFCDRCMHRYEQYRPQPQDWELLLEKLKMELALWKGSQLPSANLLSIWNNQVEHFIRSVAVG
jgi:hypothetical protein